MIDQKKGSYSTEEIIRVAELWASNSLAEISEQMNRSKISLSNLVRKMRQIGFILPKKKSIGQSKINLEKAFQEWRQGL